MVAGFRSTLDDFHRAADGIRLHNGVPENIRSLFETALGQDYCKRMIEAMRQLRNSLAHRSDCVHNHGVTTVRICADFINQLFERPEAAAS